ncbi:8056_t:CDS:2 [Acaulospora morrowiae]|uniref:8056_t:CDS:1 n=1 Tax=Acaulospora morrowiae TaxID=94023 RepID=A0A9N8V8T7_9GLOM|nr:8056_t:CDS:2 [Acaulospora morrowiae]
MENDLPREDGYYDDIYFDSDSTDDECEEKGDGEPNAMELTAKKAKSTKNRKELSPDELLYDPGMDDEDEIWMENKITQYNEMSSTMQNVDKNPSVILGTDAILSCPMCFTNLSYHTQRHETYVNQYRAIFVENCKVNRSERLVYSEHSKRSNHSNKRNSSSLPSKKANLQSREVTSNEFSDKCDYDAEGKVLNTEPSREQPEIYYPVECEICGTKVAVMDQEEVYHFFNIIAS